MHADEGTIPEAAQKDLKPTYKKQALFLACQCRPQADLRVSLPDSAGFDIQATIAEKRMLNSSVLRLRLQPSLTFTCEPGQYLTLINPAGVTRSYSIANNPISDGFIELQVRLLETGLMSGFLRSASVGQSLVIRGPVGNCFYTAEDGGDFPIVLAGTGTGLAPLYGILNQALKKQHKGLIQLFHGALQKSDLYLGDELRALAECHGNFQYRPCVLNGEPGGVHIIGDIEKAVLAGLPVDRASTRLFLCGAPEFVNALRRKAFLTGLASKHIFADAFLPAKPLAPAA